MITAPHNIVSIGRLARSLDTTREQVIRASEAAAVRFAQTIDGVPFFDADDVERIREQLKQEATR